MFWESKRMPDAPGYESYEMQARKRSRAAFRKRLAAALRDAMKKGGEDTLVIMPRGRVDYLPSIMKELRSKGYEVVPRVSDLSLSGTRTSGEQVALDIKWGSQAGKTLLTRLQESLGYHDNAWGHATRYNTPANITREIDEAMVYFSEYDLTLKTSPTVDPHLVRADVTVVRKAEMDTRRYDKGASSMPIYEELLSAREAHVAAQNAQAEVSLQRRRYIKNQLQEAIEQGVRAGAGYARVELPDDTKVLPGLLAPLVEALRNKGYQVAVGGWQAPQRGTQATPVHIWWDDPGESRIAQKIIAAVESADIVRRQASMSTVTTVEDALYWNDTGRQKLEARGYKVYLGFKEFPLDPETFHVTANIIWWHADDSKPIRDAVENSL